VLGLGVLAEGVGEADGVAEADGVGDSLDVGGDAGGELSTQALSATPSRITAMREVPGLLIL